MYKNMYRARCVNPFSLPKDTIAIIVTSKRDMDFVDVYNAHGEWLENSARNRWQFISDAPEGFTPKRKD